MDSSSRPGAAVVPSRPTVAFAALALALLLGLQPVTTDVYLPALPMLTKALAAPLPAAQMTMAALMLAFGVGQLFWGPVADRVGRKPALLAGLVLHAAAGVGAAMAPSIEWLVAWRAAQGLGLAAAVVIARAIVRDLYEPVEGARVMSLGLTGLGLIAFASPSVGGWAAAGFGWRACLALVAAGGALTLGFVALRLPETIRQRNPQATRLAPLAVQWGRIARHPTFLAWALLVSFTYGGLYTYLAGSSFIYIGLLGLGPGAFGLALASGSLAYIAGTFVCRRWILRWGVQGAVRRGGWLSIAAAAAIVLPALAGVQSVPAVLLPQWLFGFAHGIHQPCGQAGAVGPFPHAAGTASALAGFALALVAFADGRWLGSALAATSTLPFALTVGFWSLATAAVALTLVQRLPAR
ncbi:MAG: Bcr/CflA family efflux MFS transporter [Rubrivivax sp.]